MDTEAEPLPALRLLLEHGREVPGGGEPGLARLLFEDIDPAGGEIEQRADGIERPLHDRAEVGVLVRAQGHRIEHLELAPG